MTLVVREKKKKRAADYDVWNIQCRLMFWVTPMPASLPDPLSSAPSGMMIDTIVPFLYWGRTEIPAWLPPSPVAPPPKKEELGAKKHIKAVDCVWNIPVSCWVHAEFPPWLPVKAQVQVEEDVTPPPVAPAPKTGTGMSTVADMIYDDDSDWMTRPIRETESGTGISTYCDDSYLWEKK